ncbi:MAG: TIGR03936 family radical SAM-associated protein [Planctomycetota bacterium]
MTKSGIAAAQPLVQKQLLNFRKTGLLRFLSHHDLMTVFARAVRRAALPIRWTAGFNPQVRLSLPAALEVGVAALADPLELELTAWLPPPQVQARLNRCLPPDLQIVAARLTAPVRAGAIAAFSRFRWAAAAARAEAIRPEAVAVLHELPRFEVPRVLPPKRGNTHPRRRLVDVRRALVRIAVLPDGSFDWIIRHGDGAVPRVAELAAALRALSGPMPSPAALTERDVVPVGTVERTSVGLLPMVVNFLDADWWKQPVVETLVAESDEAADEVSCA